MFPQKIFRKQKLLWWPFEIDSTPKMITKHRVIENERIRQEFILIQSNPDLQPVCSKSFYSIHYIESTSTDTMHTQFSNRKQIFLLTLQENIYNWNLINFSTSLVTLTKNNTLKRLQDKDWIDLKCVTLRSSIFLHKLISTWLQNEWFFYQLQSSDVL